MSNEEKIEKLQAVISQEMGKAINEFLAEGAIDEDIIKQSPVVLLERLGYKLTKKQKARLEKMKMDELLDLAYTELGKVDKRFLLAKKESSSELASVPQAAVAVAVPIIGVGMMLIVAAVAIKVGIDIADPEAIDIEDPNEDSKI